MPVVDRQHPVFIAPGQMEQGQMPPVVGVHERIQALPVAADAFQEVDAFLDPALGQHHVGQRVLGPGLTSA